MKRKLRDKGGNREEERRDRRPTRSLIRTRMEQSRVEAHPDELKMDNRQFQPGGDLTMAKDGLKKEREEEERKKRWRAGEPPLGPMWFSVAHPIRHGETA